MTFLKVTSRGQEPALHNLNEWPISSTIFFSALLQYPFVHLFPGFSFGVLRGFSIGFLGARCLLGGVVRLTGGGLTTVGGLVVAPSLSLKASVVMCVRGAGGNQPKWMGGMKGNFAHAGTYMRSICLSKLGTRR